MTRNAAILYVSILLALLSTSKGEEVPFKTGSATHIIQVCQADMHRTI